MRDSMAKEAVKNNKEIHEWLDQLELLNEELKPIEKLLANCKEDASLTSRRAGWTFAFIILA